MSFSNLEVYYRFYLGKIKMYYFVFFDIAITDSITLTREVQSNEFSFRFRL